MMHLSWRMSLRGYLVSVLVSGPVLLGLSGAEAAVSTDLAIRVTARSMTVGANGSYAIIISNRGAADTDEVYRVIDTLPAGLSFVGARGAGWSCTAVGQSVTCTSANPLAAGRSNLLRLTVAAGAAAYPQVTNRISVSYAADSNPANNTVSRTSVVKAQRRPVRPRATPTSPLTTASPTSTGRPPRTATPTATITPPPPPEATDLSLVNTVSGTFIVGSKGKYILTLSNLGPNGTASPFTVIDTLPPGLGFVSGTGTGWVCAAQGQTVTCNNPGPLAARASTSITLTVQIGSGAYPSVTNVATATYVDDTNAANNTARKPTTIRR